MIFKHGRIPHRKSIIKEMLQINEFTNSMMILAKFFLIYMVDIIPDDIFLHTFTVYLHHLS